MDDKFLDLARQFVAEGVISREPTTVCHKCKKRFQTAAINVDLTMLAQYFRDVDSAAKSDREGTSQKQSG